MAPARPTALEAMLTPRITLQNCEAVNEPIMNTSPWAKLISSMIP